MDDWVPACGKVEVAGCVGRRGKNWKNVWIMT